MRRRRRRASLAPSCAPARYSSPKLCKFALGSPWIDRKSTRLNSSHGYISYAVFCLKKKKNIETRMILSHEIHGLSQENFLVMIGLIVDHIPKLSCDYTRSGFSRMHDICRGMYVPFS